LIYLNADGGDGSKLGPQLRQKQNVIGE